MGPQMHQLLFTLCVASSLALVALGSSDLTSGFCLGTLSFAGPSPIIGPILDTVAISRDVKGTSCKELGQHVNSCLLHLFTAPAGAHHFASSVVTPRGYKAGSHSSTQPTSSRTISYHLPASFPMTQTKEG
jgi:hypothetical protein